MKRALVFVKATLLGGVIVVLPAWLAVLLVLEVKTRIKAKAALEKAFPMLKEEKSK